MKQILPVLLILLSFFASANVVSVPDAAKVAQKVFPIHQIDIIKQTPQYYVFGVEPKGFVIVSAEDAGMPLIAYSAESEYVGNPEQLLFLKDIANNIDAIRSQNAVASPEIQKAWVTPMSNNRTAVAPLLPTKWAQDNSYDAFPYNDSCRGDLTGCVATAQAQIMNFWKYPAKGVGVHTYVSADLGTLTVNFGATTYDWANMPTDNIVTPAKVRAVAQLMYHCGVSVDMDYSNVVSYAYVHGSPPSAEYSFVHYFQYDTTLHNLQRNADATAFYNKIISELNSGRPLNYEGDGSSGGHAWVCDGYDANGLLHMNWGWGGTDNGYYAVTNLNPYVSFTNNQGILYGIKPKGTVAPPTCDVPTGLTVSAITQTSAHIHFLGSGLFNLDFNGFVKGLHTNDTTITGLTANTSYSVRVQQICPTLNSAYSSAVTFTTLPIPSTCDSVTNFQISNVKDTSVTISFTGTTGKYNVDLYHSGIHAFSTITGSPKVIHPLLPVTSYTIAIQQVCDAINSLYTNPIAFRTLATIPPDTIPVIPPDTTHNPIDSGCVNSFDPNNDMESATGINQDSIYHSMIANAIDTDFYIISTDTPKTNITVNLFDLPANYALKLLNADGIVLKSSNNGGTNSEKVTYNTKIPQSYFVMVYGSTKKSYVYSGYCEHHSKTIIPNFSDTACYSLQVTTTKSKQHKCGDDGDINSDEVIPVVLYPNPAHNYISLSGSIENPYYEIINTLGQTVQSGIYSENIININIQNGVYLLRIDGQSIIFVVQ